MPEKLPSPPPKYAEGDLVFFHADPEWELDALHDSDGCAYDQNGTTYSTAVVVSLKGFDWCCSYDVLCGDGVLRCLSAFDIEGVVKN